MRFVKCSHSNTAAGSLVRHCLKLLLPTEKGHLPTLDLYPNGSNLKCGRVETAFLRDYSVMPLFI